MGGNVIFLQANVQKLPELNKTRQTNVYYCDSQEAGFVKQHYDNLKTRGSAIAEELRDALRQLKYYGRFLTQLLTRSSANPKEPCEHNVS